MPNDERIDIRVPADEKATYAEAAKADGIPVLSAWMRWLASTRAKKVLKSKRR